MPSLGLGTVVFRNDSQGRFSLGLGLATGV